MMQAGVTSAVADDGHSGNDDDDDPTRARESDCQRQQLMTLIAFLVRGFLFSPPRPA